MQLPVGVYSLLIDGAEVDIHVALPLPMYIAVSFASQRLGLY